MKELFYAGGSVIISDDMASALLEYATALAAIVKADVVEIPAVSRDGAQGSAQMLLGPASQLWATATSKDGMELDDSDDIRILKTKSGMIQPARPQTSEREGSDTFHEFE
jgi:hypothetical protein